MKSKLSSHFLPILLFGLLAWPVHPILAQKGTPKDSTVNAAQKEDQEYLRLLEAVDQHKTLLENYPNSEFAGTVLFQLAELYARLSRLDFSRSMAKYEQELDRFDKGELRIEPIMPRISYRETIELCYRLLKEYPRSEYRDRVLYQLSMSHLEEGNFEKAREYFNILLTQYPASEMAMEAHFRLGEYFFEHRDFPNCIKHYSQLVGKWDSPFFNMALYKLGWAYNNTYDYSNAISTFIYLIEDIDMLEEVNSQIMGKTKADLRSESISYIASCFTEIGGPTKARDFLEAKKDKDWVLDVFIKMGDMYQKRNEYSLSIATYELLLDIYPFYEFAPELYIKIIQSYESDHRIAEANKAREEMAKKFGPGSPWLVQYSEGEPKRKALDLAEKALYELGTYYQSEAQANKRTQDYLKAIDNYRQFLEQFPRGNNSCAINYYLAECLYEVKDYKGAAEAYHATATLYDTCSFTEDAAYNRILCYYKLSEQPGKPDSATIYLDEFLGANEVKAIKVSDENQANLIRACNDLLRQLPNSKYVPEVLMKFGEVLYQIKNYLAAIDVYKRVLELGKESGFYLQAAMNAAQSYFDAGLFRESDVWFRKIAELFPDSSEIASRAKLMTSSSQFKLAEKDREKTDYLTAATRFLQIAENTEDLQIKERSYNEAATTFFQAGDTTRSAETFELLARKLPKSDKADDALYKAAGLWEALQQWEKAAADYLQLADSFPSSEFASGSVLSAAVALENAQNWPAAERAYERFANVFAKTPDEAIEANYKIGEMAFKKGDFIRSRQFFEKTTTLFSRFADQGEGAADYFPAQAQFMLGEIEFENYKKIKLTNPMDVSLKLKQKHLNLVLKAYTQTLSFKVADWATAASFRIGNAFEEFAHFFKDAPAPENLSPEQLRAYNTKLDSVYIRPLQEKALQAYTGNVKQAEANGIDNSWVSDSRNRIQSLIAILNPGSQQKSDSTGAANQPTQPAVPTTPAAGQGVPDKSINSNNANKDNDLVYKQGKNDGM